MVNAATSTLVNNCYLLPLLEQRYGYNVSLKNYSAQDWIWIVFNESWRPYRCTGVPNQPCWFTKNHLTRVRYIENLDLTNFWENNHNVCYIEVKLMINFQRLAFPNPEIFCNKHLHPKLLCQFWAVRSYDPRNTRIRKQNCLKLLYT